MLWFVRLIFCLWLSVIGTAALAHAAEQGFVLLLPTNLYIAGGTLTVAVTLGLVGLVRHPTIRQLFHPITLARGGIPTLGRNAVSGMTSVIVLCLCGLGFWGPTDPLSNLLPLTIWTVWWIGFVALVGFLGNLWLWLNPWTGIFETLFGKAKPILPYPVWLQSWPAVCLLVGFNIFAIADIAPSDPRRLAGVVLAYWTFTLVGMRLFGPVIWLTRVEFFSVMFSLIGRLAPVQCATRMRIGFPGWAATLIRRPDASTAVFCIVLLGSGSFDGLHKTFWWMAQIGINPLEYPGRSAVFLPSTSGLVGANVLLVLVFVLACGVGVVLVAQFGTTRLSTIRTSCALSLSILPIALGYHIAHFLPSFLVQIQYFLLALADPMGRGATMFGLPAFEVTTGFLSHPQSVRTIWLTQAGAVVLSHVLAVLVAHRIAGRIAPKGMDALLLQVGVSILMVIYTIFGLWLLASPRGA